MCVCARARRRLDEENARLHAQLLDRASLPVTESSGFENTHTRTHTHTHKHTHAHIYARMYTRMLAKEQKIQKLQASSPREAFAENI